MDRADVLDDRFDLEPVANLLAAAFIDYPVMRALAGPIENQRRVLPYFFRCCTRHAHVSGGVVSCPGGAALWLDSQLGPTTLESIRCGLAWLPFRVGMDRVRRAALHERAGLELIDRSVRGRYGCLWFVGVEPGRTGQGISHVLVDRSLAAMARRGLTRCVLTTEKETNVTIWSRCGFELLEHRHVDATDLPLWLMGRDLTPPD